MAVRQYIGARYVPRFFENPNNTAEWLPNVIYEPLTIVTYGLNSYTSKKTVPASVGDPANNPDYWVATGNMNAFINELQNQIDDMNDGTVTGSLQNQINTMNDGDVTGSLQNQIDTMKDGEVSGSLQNQIDTMKDGNVSGSLQNQINGAKNDISFLEKYHKPEKIMLITDSYGNQVNSESHTIAYIVGDILDIPCSKISVSGGSMHAGEILTAVQNYSGDTDYDTIVIVAGANDQSNSDHSTAIINGIVDLVAEIKSKFNPNTIMLMCPGLTFDATYTTNSRMELAKYYKAGARKAGIKYIDNSQYILCSTTLLQNDHCHPNSDGVNFLAEKIVEAILTGYNDVIITLNTQNTAQTRHYYMIRHNGHVSVRQIGASPVIFSTNSSVDGTGASVVVLDTLENSLVELTGDSGRFNVALYGYCTVGSAEERLAGSMFISNKQIKGYLINKSYASSTTNRLIGFFDCDD